MHCNAIKTLSLINKQLNKIAYSNSFFLFFKSSFSSDFFLTSLFNFLNFPAIVRLKSLLLFLTLLLALAILLIELHLFNLFLDLNFFLLYTFKIQISPFKNSSYFKITSMYHLDSSKLHHN